MTLSRKYPTATVILLFFLIHFAGTVIYDILFRSFNQKGRWQNIRMTHPNSAPKSLIGFYLLNLAANLTGNFIIALLNFLDGRAPEDDMTMIVIKTMDD